MSETLFTFTGRAGEAAMLATLNCTLRCPEVKMMARCLTSIGTVPSCPLRIRKGSFRFSA